MGGLADALAMQGRRGDSTLVHMNPMEVRMLETMSPDGRLSINPETGLPEAFKLKDVAAFALPIAASIAMPYLAPALVGSIGAVGAGAVGAGLGGVGAGLIQGKGLKDSLVQGGISGLMSYGLGSAFAPATQTAPQALSNVPTAAAPSFPVAGSESAAADVLAGAGMMAPSNISTASSMTGTPAVSMTMMRPDAASIATLGQSATAAGLPAPGTPTSSFANFGLGPKGSVPYTAATDVYQPGTSETGLGQLFDRASRKSPFGQTDIYGDALGATQVPTYTQIGGSVLGSAGQMALEDMLSPEEMPYDIAGMDEMDAYYASRVPNLDAGRLRGQAAARGLNYPPSGGSAADYYGMATSPGGFGTFYAADGGRVPTDLNINGEPHQLSYINQDEAAVLRGMGGAGRDVMGVPAYFGGALSNLLPQIAEQAMQNPEAYGLSRGPATAADLSSGKTTGVNNARTVKDELLNLLSSDYYGMATSPGGFGTFLAADGGQVPKPYGDPYGPGDPYGGMSDESNFGQSSSTGQSSGTPGSVDTSGFMSSLGDPIDIGLGIGNPSPIGMAASLAGLALGIPGLGPAVAVGRGIAGLMGPSVPGQVSGFGTTTGGPTGIGIGVTGQAVDPDFEAVSDGYGGTGMGGEDSGSGDQGDTGVGHGAGEGTSDVGGWAQGGGISSLAYGGEAAPVGFANKAFEGMVPGQGTGMSDDVPFSIEGNQPALLSRDEYVFPADVVSQLGDGSSSAGADMLDNFISQVRQTKYGNTQQPAPVGPQLMTGLMRQGGVV